MARKKIYSFVAVQKGLLISPEILRRWFEGLEQLGTFQVPQAKGQTRVVLNEAVLSDGLLSFSG